jgi:hypothetical protein
VRKIYLKKGDLNADDKALLEKDGLTQPYLQEILGNMMVMMTVRLPPQPHRHHHLPTSRVAMLAIHVPGLGSLPPILPADHACRLAHTNRTRPPTQANFSNHLNGVAEDPKAINEAVTILTTALKISDSLKDEAVWAFLKGGK